MIQLILKYKLIVLGLVGGAVAGYAYYFFVGCASGSCAITSNPVNSTAYGALMGAVLLSGFRKENSNTNTKNNEKSEDNN